MERKIFWLLFIVPGAAMDFTLLIWRSLALTMPLLVGCWWVALEERMAELDRVRTHRMTGVGVGVGCFLEFKFEPLARPGDCRVEGVEGCFCTSAGDPVTDGC